MTTPIGRSRATRRARPARSTTSTTRSTSLYAKTAAQTKRPAQGASAPGTWPSLVGQALVLGQPILLPYAAVFTVAVVAFVHYYEEPTLRRQFGEQYEAYRRGVPGCWPRREPSEASKVDRP